MRTPARRKFGLTTTMVKLNNDQVKQLLLEAEASPFPREKLKFRDICDRWPNFFGEPATDLRRSHLPKKVELSEKLASARIL